MAAVSRRGRSSAPIAAALVALAVILCGIWLELSNLAGAMAITGVGRETMTMAVRDTSRRELASRSGRSAGS